MDCVTKFGELLGVSRDGTAAYSNCHEKFYSGDLNFYEGIQTGVTWQCVEYARRWLLKNQNLIFDEVTFAFEIWDKVEFFFEPQKSVKKTTKNFKNKNPIAPKSGDLLIYGKEHLGTGHVAVIDEVNLESGFITVLEANFENVKWPAHYARKLKLISEDGHFSLDEQHLLGWKRPL